MVNSINTKDKTVFTKLDAKLHEMLGNALNCAIKKQPMSALDNFTETEYFHGLLSIERIFGWEFGMTEKGCSMHVPPLFENWNDAMPYGLLDGMSAQGNLAIMEFVIKSTSYKVVFAEIVGRRILQLERLYLQLEIKRLKHEAKTILETKETKSSLILNKLLNMINR